MYQDIIPETHLPAVETAIRQAFQTTAPDSISLLSGGLSGSAVYKITVHNKAYILKLDTKPKAAANGLGTLLQQVSDAGIAPPLLYHDQAAGISINGFIEGKPAKAMMQADKLVSALGKTLRTLHHLPYTGESQDLAHTIDELITAFGAQQILYGPVVSTCLEGYERIRTINPWLETDRVPAHNDLNPGNILSDGEKIWLIDWDAAMPNDRFVDLAAAANFFAANETLEQLLLQVYYDRAPTQEEIARLFLMRQVSRLVYGMLLSQAAAQVQAPGYQHNQDMEPFTTAHFGERLKSGNLSLGSYEGLLFYAKVHFNEARHHMQSARFEASLTLLSKR